MSKWKLVLLVTATVLVINFFCSTDWQIPTTPIVSLGEIKGFEDGKSDAMTGRGYQKGFYHPPARSANYWTGYCKGFGVGKVNN